MPFQLRPDSRVTLEFSAASERMTMPFRMLRCYVSSLHGGVRYQAAGEFEQLLDWEPLSLVDPAAQVTSDRLIATLEASLRRDPTTGRVEEFDRMLIWVLEAARRGERADRIAVEIQLRLPKLIPTLVVEPTRLTDRPDPTRGARFFGFDFNCQRPLNASDRNVLRTAAQLLSIVTTADLAPKSQSSSDVQHPQNTESRVITHSVADWMEMCVTNATLQEDPWQRSA